MRLRGTWCQLRNRPLGPHRSSRRSSREVFPAEDHLVDVTESPALGHHLQVLANDRPHLVGSDLKVGSCSVEVGGCNHCNKEGHKRQDCPEFLAIKAKNNGKLPEGYKGAREIAYGKWRSNQKACIANNDNQAKNVRALASAKAQLAAHNTEDEDSNFSEFELPAIAKNEGIVAALTRQEAIETHNTLVNELDDQIWEPVKMGTRLEDAIIKPKSQLPDRSNSNMWSGLTKVTAKKSKPLKYFTIRTEADLDKMLKTHPTVASLPANKEFRSELSALALVSNKYVHIMMDIGASIHAACMQKHVPGHFVQQSVGHKNRKFAHTANGK